MKQVGMSRKAYLTSRVELARLCKLVLENKPWREAWKEKKTLIMTKRCVAQGCNSQPKGDVSVDERASSTRDVTSGMVDLSIDSEKGVISI